MKEDNEAVIKALNMYGRVPETWELLEEIERLNNIINELEKWLEERLEKLDINGYDDDVFNGIEIALQKLEELKGSNKE